MGWKGVELEEGKQGGGAKHGKSCKYAQKQLKSR